MDGKRDYTIGARIVVHRSRTMSMTYSSDERRCESVVSSMKMFLQAFLSSLLPTLP